MINKKTVQEIVDYFKTHFYFINFRYRQGPKFFTEYYKLNPEYVGNNFKPLLSQAVWISLANKVVKDKAPCETVKSLYEYQSDFWLASAKDIGQKLKCVQNWANQIPVVKKTSE